MNAPEDLPYDLALVGAGGAGMCLLLALHQQGLLSQRRVLVLEAAEKTNNDRTWCFWAKPNDPLVEAVNELLSNAWDQASMAGHQQALAPYHYYELRAGAFYAFVKNLCSAYPLLHWQSTSVLDVEAVMTGGYYLHTPEQRYFSQQVADSRSQHPPRGNLVQSFVGWRVRSKQPANGGLQLMQFEQTDAKSCEFWYILPGKNNECLVELTRFDRHLLVPQTAEPQIASWLQQHLGDYALLETESGQLPMGLMPKAEQRWSHHIRLGMAAGVMRSSTGYAFSRMYRHATEIAKAVGAQSALPAYRQHPRHRFYDAVFLNLLERQPALGRMLFARMYSRVAAPVLFRFLDEDSSLADEARVIASLPWIPFLRSWWQQTQQMRWLVAALLLLCLLLQFFAPAVLPAIAPWLLAAGLVFPGLPHGAVDHLLHGRKWPLPLFVGFYLLVMLAVVLFWSWQPGWGLLLFLAYSAWHFGETDFNHWHMPQPFAQQLYGWGVLGWILGNHPAEWVFYLQALGVTYVPPTEPLLWLSGVVLLWTGLLVPAHRLRSYAATVLVLLAGAFLPLLLAFGFYFLGLHSRRGWQHLQIRLQLSQRELFKKALPFSLGGWLSFAGLGLAAQFYGLSFDGWIPAFFVFLAAVSAPHIVLMSGLYQRTAGSTLGQPKVY
jgi:lycopene beta-cyclase